MVSKGYLRAWADARKVVDVVDLDRRRGYQSSIENATVASYAYDTNVLQRGLEEEYSEIESRGLMVVLKLRRAFDLTPEERASLVAFLDMHSERGRYADQVNVDTPAVVVKTGGRVEPALLNAADRLLLSRFHRDRTSLAERGIDKWEWRIAEHPTPLITGDGGVLLWSGQSAFELATVSFPLSPTQLLEIGRSLPVSTSHNSRVIANSRRWLVGAAGTFVEAASRRK